MFEIQPNSIEEFKEIIQQEGNFECWKASGLTCFIYRFKPWGYWCGYVGVPKSHKLYGLDYQKPSKALKSLWEKRKRQKVNIKRLGLGVLTNILFGELKPSPENIFDVHGGITFSGQHRVWKLDNKWFFGFDTCHHGDLNLSLILSSRNPEEELKEWENFGHTYKTKEYVIRETEKLAYQIAAV